VRRRHVETELLHQARQPRRLTFGKVEHEPGQRRRVDDRMLEWTFEAATNEPGVERIMAVLDENRAVSESQERPARIPELGCADEH
jgi:hypothetical protein